MKKKLYIALDTNTFRNQKFIDYLIFHKSDFDVGMPFIVQLELGYFYRLKGILYEEFLDEMKKINITVMELSSIISKEIIEKAFSNKTQLPFREHFRDFIIGIQAQKAKRLLITYNITHFQWLIPDFVITPENLVIKHFETKDLS